MRNIPRSCSRRQEDPMANITKIEPYAGKYNVYVGDKCVCTLSTDTVLSNKLETGTELTYELLEKLTSEDEGRRAVSSALNYVSYCARTANQVRTNLNRKGFGEKSIDHAIHKLTEYGYLNDKDYAERYATDVSKKYGPRMISAKLTQKGVSKDIVEQATEGVACDQLENARALYDKLNAKYDGIDKYKKRQKIYAALMRRGFEWDEISVLFEEDY